MLLPHFLGSFYLLLREFAFDLYRAHRGYGHGSVDDFTELLWGVSTVVGLVLLGNYRSSIAIA